MNRILFPFAAALLAACTSLATDSAPTATESGATLFARYCVSCHGARGHGDGPVAPSLIVEPSDLTRISARNGGEFPAERVREKIEGRVVIGAHGPREMPVWGYELEARAPADEPGRAAAQGMTDQLVEFLRSIQR
jgi:mono/diheme cytochrome c family protein